MYIAILFNTKWAALQEPALSGRVHLFYSYLLIELYLLFYVVPSCTMEHKRIVTSSLLTV